MEGGAKKRNNKATVPVRGNLTGCLRWSCMLPELKMPTEPPSASSVK